MAMGQRGARREMTGDGEHRDDREQSHEAAINRLREIAENGLDDPALDRPENTDPAALADALTDADEAAARERCSHLRIVEAMVFAAPEPLSEKKIQEQLPFDADVRALLEELRADYAERGVQLVRVAGKWAFRTADDLSYLLEKYALEERRLSKAALETLAIIAYHQPVTRAEIEEIRGVQTSRGTLDVLMETGWIRPRGRRRSPGKPVTYGTTDAFLSHFGLESLGDLPGLAELKGAGLLDSDLPPDFAVPNPKEVAAMMPDELPLEDDSAETEDRFLNDDAAAEQQGDTEPDDEEQTRDA